MSCDTPVIFDGANGHGSFSTFLQGLKLEERNKSEGYALEHLIPTRLYGQALRFYESLDRDCQAELSELCVALENEFPGSSSDDLVPLGGTPLPEGCGISTPAAIAPTTASGLSFHSCMHAMDQAKGVPGASTSQIIGSFNTISQRLRSLSLSRFGIRPSQIMYIHAACFYIEFPRGGGKPATRVIEVDLRDWKAVSAANARPLLDVTRQDLNDYHGGFEFALNYGRRSVGIGHDVSGPKSNIHSFILGERELNPLRQLPPLSWHVVESLPDSKGQYWNRPPNVKAGTYNIRSYIRTWSPDYVEKREKRNYGSIEWKLRVRDS